MNTNSFSTEINQKMNTHIVKHMVDVNKYKVKLPDGGSTSEIGAANTGVGKVLLRSLNKLRFSTALSVEFLRKLQAKKKKRLRTISNSQLSDLPKLI